MRTHTEARPIYLDHHATTPTDPRVLEAMLPFFADEFGNPASRSHAYGWRANDAVQEAREQVARLLGARSAEIVFTSGATEANNLAILGFCRANHERGRHIVTSAIEHKAVLDACKQAGREGFEVTVIEPDAEGRIAPERIEAALRDDTILVSLQWVNNEVGSVQDIAAVGALCRARGIALHTDAVQGLAWLPCDVEALGVSLLSLSAHKMYGPKGVGALYVRRQPRMNLVPLVFGGGQERGLRAGTLPVPLLVGLGEACALTRTRAAADSARVAALRDALWQQLSAALPDAIRHGPAQGRHPGNLSLAIPFAEAEALLLELSSRVALSSGSACTSARIEPSHVLRALGVPSDLARCSLRIGLGRHTTEDEVARAGDAIVAAAHRVREASPVYLAAGSGLPTGGTLP